MPVIRISDYVMEMLKKYAIPLQDNPDSVLRRVLDEYASLKQSGQNDYIITRSGESPRTMPAPKTSAEKTSFPRAYAERYTRWIIPSLIALGGSADAQTVISQIRRRFGNEFTEKDQETLPSGEIRWVKNVNWARYDLVNGGLLDKNAPYGIWELTDKGRAYYIALQGADKSEIPGTSPSQITELKLPFYGSKLPINKLLEMRLDKHAKPHKLQLDNQEFNVQTWTEVCKYFVEWLIMKNLLTIDKVPILNGAKRDKYFINTAPKHKNYERDGAWQKVGKFYIDTKYNAGAHVKNLLYTLNYLGVSGDNVLISLSS
jgi:hypothetical protein